MSRPTRLPEQRRELAPVVAATFTEYGYRRTTTAELARRCEVRENILYRLWKDKKEMFIAALDYVYERAAAEWEALEEQDDGSRTVAERTLDHEAETLGEMGYHRIIFAGLSESDDPEIRAAMSRMYKKFHTAITHRIRQHRTERGVGSIDPALAAWAIVGLGTAATITRELDLAGAKQRRALVSEVGRHVVNG